MGLVFHNTNSMWYIAAAKGVVPSRSGQYPRRPHCVGSSPEAAGDYLAGPNHTLPTSGTARFSGALSVETFMRHTSLINFNREALEATGAAIMTLAASEGLHSHSESVRRRLSS